MKFRTLMLPALVSACIISTAYAAEDAGEAEKSAGELSATITGVTDYVDRGVTQNDEHPALQGSVDYEHSSGVYVGLWGSQVDFDDGGITHAEVGLYGGYTFPVGSDVNMTAEIAGYVYPGSDQGVDHYNFIELKGAAEKDFGLADITAEVYFSPDNFASSGPATYITLSGKAPIAKSGFSLTGSAGYQWIDDEALYGLPDYADWSVGAEYSLQGFDLALKYTDTDLSEAECADGCEARGVFSVGKTF